LQLPCGARQLRGAGDLPAPGGAAVAPGADAAKPTCVCHLVAHEALGQAVAPPCSHPASLSERALPTPAPEAGAQCGSPARWDLCGGPPVRAVPTATTHGPARSRAPDVHVCPDHVRRRPLPYVIPEFRS